jgi:hypothetical protein
MDPANLLTSEFKNLLEVHGEVSLAQVKAHAAVYVNTHSRATQDSMQLYECCLNSTSRVCRVSGPELP